MGLRVNEFLRKIGLPKKYFDSSFIISEKFSQETDEFLRLLLECDGVEFDTEKSKKVQNIFKKVEKTARKVSDIILNIFEYYEKSNYKKAEQLLDCLMAMLKKDLFFGTIDDRIKIKYRGKKYISSFRITRAKEYHRVRTVETQYDLEKENAYEMFHIPLSKRAYSSNERFSTSGFPSLYLATMLPLAWQESGYPQKYYHSEFQYIEDGNELNILSLYSPEEMYAWGMSYRNRDFEFWLDMIARYLKTYPLVLACSFVNQSGKVPYKQEYIIPQMLMQWVQRNIEKVHGIAYFTCVDTSMWLGGWCAYNIAIPAIPPYDDEKYSVYLQEKFCWTKPKYYEIPIWNKQFSEEDRQFLDNLIVEIREFMRMFHCQDKLRKTVVKMLNIVGSLKGLIEEKSGISMQQTLHFLNSIMLNIESLGEPKLKEDIVLEIQEGRTKCGFNEPDMNHMINTFCNIHTKFRDRINEPKTLAYIVEKYRAYCWNYYSDDVKIEVFCKDEKEQVQTWFTNNHILHWVVNMDDSAEFIYRLKRSMTDANLPMNTLFEDYVDNDEWIAKNIHLLKTPIFFKRRSNHIYSKPGTKSCELICIGYDESVLTEKCKND